MLTVTMLWDHSIALSYHIYQKQVTLRQLLLRAAKQIISSFVYKTVRESLSKSPSLSVYYVNLVIGSSSHRSFVKIVLDSILKETLKYAM